MARYIDADWIYEKVENRYRLSSGIEHRCERDLLDLICSAPTADVVPKSEADEYKHCWQKIHDSYTADCLEHYNKGRQDAAREIIDHIDGWFMYCENYGGHIIKNRLAELKKKYTGENEP